MRKRNYGAIYVDGSRVPRRDPYSRWILTRFMAKLMDFTYVGNDRGHNHYGRTLTALLLLRHPLSRILIIGYLTTGFPEGIAQMSLAQKCSFSLEVLWNKVTFPSRPVSGPFRVPSLPVPCPVPSRIPSRPFPSLPVPSLPVPSLPVPSLPVPSVRVLSRTVSHSPSTVPISFPSRSVPFRPVPSRSVPFRPVPSRPVPSRSCPVSSRVPFPVSYPVPSPSRPIPSRSLPVPPRIPSCSLTRTLLS